LSAALLAGCATVPVDVCLDSRLPNNPAIQECRIETLPYRAGDTISNVQIVRLFHGTKSDFDTFKPVYTYYLRTPTNALVPFGSFGRRSDGISHEILLGLGINSSMTGGSQGMDPSMFYDVWIDRAADAYCLAYRMKLPFTGELRYCGEEAKRTSTVSYGSGVWSWRGAMQTVCESVARESGGRCQGNDVEPWFNVVKRNPSGDLSYIVAVRRHLVGRPELAKTRYFLYAQVDYLVYRFNPLNGQMALLEHTDKMPEATHWRSTSAPS